MKNYTDFIDYILEFYAPGGMYDIGMTREAAWASLDCFLDCINPVEFEGDTFDREGVRDVFLNHFKEG